ncbi:hypothetical protein Taro_042712 [Colocasia esculenta]|uniref:Uncharacterized protein n=1 Tax=Colocasia esculenta TaxID=4460 RepID=A0A843WX70_COLES|nr:hypothetical protein [Colocasia esculenta]
MSNKFGALEEWRTAGENVVFLNLALHQPRNLQRILSIQRVISELLTRAVRSRSAASALATAAAN